MGNKKGKIGGARKGAGRPKAKLGPKGADGKVAPEDEFSIRQVRALARINPTTAELAGMLGIDERTVRRRKVSDHDFARALLEGQAEGHIALRRKLYQKAGVFDEKKEGDGPTLRFLAMNELGMSRKYSVIDEVDLNELSDEQLQRIADGEHPLRVLNSK